MTGMIIWLVVVIYIINHCISKAKKNQQNTRPNVPRQQGRPPMQQGRPQMQQSRPPMQQNVAPPRPQQTVSRRQHDKKQKKQPRPQMQPQKENAILQRAKQNVSEHFEDDTLEQRRKAGSDLSRVPLGDEIMKDHAMAEHIHSEHTADHAAELSNRHGVDDLDTYHLMDEVNDLIVKGYSGSLAFERDFIAEATDMLGRMYQ